MVTAFITTHSYSSYGIHELDGTAEEKGENAVGLKYVHENENLMYKGKGMSDNSNSVSSYHSSKRFGTDKAADYDYF